MKRYYCPKIKLSSCLLEIGMFLALCYDSSGANEIKALKRVDCMGTVCIEMSENLLSSKVSILSSLKAAVASVVKNSVLKEKLPKRWTILVDSSWSKTPGGYASLSLKDSKGNSAILVTPSAIRDEVEATAVVAHEATHLAHLLLKPKEESWMLEGVALLMEEIVAERSSPYIRDGFAMPETSLIASLDVHQPNYKFGSEQAAQYGHLAQYFSYVHRLCGGPKLVRELLDAKHSKIGIALMDEILPIASAGTRSEICRDFASSFRAFSLARIKGSQNSWDDPEYVFIGQQPVPIRACPSQLPSWSSSIYRLGSKGCSQKPLTQCAPDEIPWGGSRCIQIKEK